MEIYPKFDFFVIIKIVKGIEIILQWLVFFFLHYAVFLDQPKRNSRLIYGRTETPGKMIELFK